MPDADVVFWSYNWWGPGRGEAVMKMIDNLPTDITYLVTFELSEQYKMDDVTKFVCDYSIARPGPSDTFRYEAKLAKEKGIKVYGSYDARDWELTDNRFIDYMHLDKIGTNMIWNVNINKSKE